MKIFISYKSENRSFALLLRENLIAWGHSTWMDKFDIAPAENWDSAVQRGLEEIDLTIGVMTSEAQQSENVLDEWYWTVNVGHKPLILLKLDDCKPVMNYARKNRIDFYKIGNDAGFELLNEWLKSPHFYLNKAHTQDEFSNYLQEIYDSTEKLIREFILSPENPMMIAGETSLEPVGKKLIMQRFFPSIDIGSSESVGSFDEAFEKFAGRVLLLGEAGAGKTIALLLKMRDAVTERRFDPSALLPFYGRLADWNASEQTPIAKWLVAGTSISPQIVQREIDNGNCLLLLDGLDELGSKRIEKDENDNEISYDPRKRFIEQIPTNNKVVISCRITDYEELGQQIKLSGAITLHALSDEQIHEYLSATEATSQLWEALQKQPDLLEVARNPLLLSLFAFAFRDDISEELRSLKDLTKDELRDAIFEQYLNRSYKHENMQYVLRGEDPPFTIRQLIYIFGNVAIRDMGKTGFFVDEPNVHALAIGIYMAKNISLEIPIDEAARLAQPYIQYIIKLRVVLKDSYAFIHNLLRDYIVVEFIKDLFLEEAEAHNAHALSLLGWMAFYRQKNLLQYITSREWFLNRTKWGRENWKNIDSEELNKVVMIIKALSLFENISENIYFDLFTGFQKVVIFYESRR